MTAAKRSGSAPLRAAAVFALVWSLLLLTAPAQSPAAAPVAPPDGLVLDLGNEGAPLARPDDSEAVRAALAGFAPRPGGFTLELRPEEPAGEPRVWRVSLPSPRPSGFEAVDRVVGYLYQPAAVAPVVPVPAIVLLHHLSDSIRIERLVASRLAARGVATLILLFPGYGDRAHPDYVGRGFLGEDLEQTRAAIRQAVADVRRAVFALRHVPWIDARRVTLMGTSLGAIIAATVAGVDAELNGLVLVMGGGDLARIVLNPSRETRRMRARLETQGIDSKTLAAELAGVDGLTFAHRIDPGIVLSIAAERDDVIPPACTRALLDLVPGARSLTWSGDHYRMPVFHLEQIVAEAAAQASRPDAEPKSDEKSGQAGRDSTGAAGSDG